MERPKPLAERLRPDSLEQIIGQTDTVRLLQSFVEQGELPSMVFWGPPGSGKTTLCKVLAKVLMWDSASLNATSASVKDIRNLAERSDLTWEQWEKRTLVFIDEIHRLNKGQQDVLLPFLENGTFVLLGSTTENPYFSLNQALRSRVQLVTLKALTVEQTAEALLRAVPELGLDFPENRGKIADAASGELEEGLEKIIEWISVRSAGDLRLAYSVLEGAHFLAKSSGRDHLLLRDAQTCLATTGVSGDRAENHFDLASAYQKSLRGSDADASIYYLARFLLSGEDPRFIARRLMVTASEDVGNQDPQAFLLAQAAYQSVDKLGMPEARIPLAQATIYVAKAPKNNQAVTSIDKAVSLLESSPLPSIPDHLKDKHQPGLSKGANYIYTHDHPDQHQTFLPDSIQGGFVPKERLVERHVERLVERPTTEAPKGRPSTEPALDPNHARILDYFKKPEYQDWFSLDMVAMAKSLEISEKDLRESFNELVRRGKIQFRRQFRVGGPDGSVESAG